MGSEIESDMEYEVSRTTKANALKLGDSCHCASVAWIGLVGVDPSPLSLGVSVNNGNDSQQLIETSRIILET
ncbi:MAG: hypothetical protein WCA79_12075 [Anaerolineales bacterium]